MDVDIDEIGNKSRIKPRESLTQDVCDEFENICENLLSNQRNEMILDCKDVSFIDSKALELLSRMHSSALRKGGSLKIIGLNEILKDVMVATRLINVFYIYEDIQEALKSAK